MADLLPLDILSRWVHVGTAIVILGGSVFMRFVLMPAAARLPDEAHDTLRKGVQATWRKFVGIGIGLFVLSGFYNYWRALPLHEGDALYHGLLGGKIILSFAVFFLASALTGRAALFEGFRQQRKKWLGILILLAAIVAALAGIAKVAAKPSPSAAGASAGPSAPETPGLAGTTISSHANRVAMNAVAFDAFFR